MDEALGGIHSEIDYTYAKKAKEVRDKNKRSVEAAMQNIIPIEYDQGEALSLFLSLSPFLSFSLNYNSLQTHSLNLI